MRDVNKSVYTDNDYLSYLLDTMQVFVYDKTDKVTMVIRLLNRNEAKALFTVTGADGHKRTYEFPMNIQDAKFFMDTLGVYDGIKDYHYGILFGDDHCKIIQYESLPSGTKRIPHQNVFTIPLQATSNPVSAPAVYGNHTCEICKKYVFSASAFIQLPPEDEDAVLTMFIIEYLGYSFPYSILPNARHGEIEFYMYINPNYGVLDEIPVTVTAIDNKGHKNSTVFVIKVDNGSVEMPEIIQPYNGEFITNAGELFVSGSEFQTSSTAFNPIHDATEYLITTDYDGKNPVFQHTSKDLCELTAAKLIIDPPLHRDGESKPKEERSNPNDKTYNGIYYLRIRYKERRLGWTFWSKPRLLHVADNFSETISRPYITGPCDVFVGRRYKYNFRCKPITSNVATFVVTYKGKRYALPAINNEADLYIDILADDYGYDNLLLVQAFDTNGVNSFYQYLELHCQSYTVAGDVKIGMPMYGTVTIDRASLLSNTKIDEKAVVTNVVTGNPINGIVTDNEDGSVTFRATGTIENPAGFEFAVTDSYGVVSKARVNVRLLQPIPVNMDICYTERECHYYVEDKNLDECTVMCFEDNSVLEYKDGSWSILPGTIQEYLGDKVPLIAASNYNDRLFEITDDSIKLYYM